MKTTNKYIDAILDAISRKGGVNNLDELDKEYLKRLHEGTNTSDIEEKYEQFDAIKNFIFGKREPKKEWDFVVIGTSFEATPLWYDKETKELMMYGDSIWFYEFNQNKKVYFGNYNSYIKAIEESWNGDLLNDIIREMYFSNSKEELKKAIYKVFKNHGVHKQNGEWNGSRWIITDFGCKSNELEIGRGYTPDKNHNYAFCSFPFFKIVFNKY